MPGWLVHKQQWLVDRLLRYALGSASESRAHHLDVSRLVIGMFVLKSMARHTIRQQQVETKRTLLHIGHTKRLNNGNI